MWIANSGRRSATLNLTRRSLDRGSLRKRTSHFEKGPDEALEVGRSGEPDLPVLCRLCSSLGAWRHYTHCTCGCRHGHRGTKLVWLQRSGTDRETGQKIKASHYICILIQYVCMYVCRRPALRAIYKWVCSRHLDVVSSLAVRARNKRDPGMM